MVLQRVTLSARLPWLEVEASEGLYLNRDGESMESQQLCFSVLPAALRVHLPEHSPLLQQ
jgi:diacylglycerol kinase family enzyme